MKVTKKLKMFMLFSCMAALGILSSAVAVFAESTGTANTQVVTAMTSLANDMIATGTAIIPIALGVVGLTAAVVFGIRIFSQISKRRA